MSEAALFPIFLKLSGRACVVVGGGSVAEGKIMGLFQAGATVRVISPEATEQIAAWSCEGRLTWDKDEFRSGDLSGAFLVVSATNDSCVNAAVRTEAELLGILCNAVDDPEHCNFYYPAVVRRGPLQIAISTAGNSPALAQRLRAEMEEQFGPDYDDWVKQLGKDRQQLFANKSLDSQLRRQTLHEQASRGAFEAFIAGTGRKQEPKNEDAA